RTPPKTQASLLQAMQEKNVSIGRKTYELDKPFMVLATQNPIEMEGTYVLPEAQLDRFMFCLKVDYPSETDEVAIVKGTTGVDVAKVQRIIGTKELIQLQDIVRAVPVADDVITYAVRLVAATRVEDKQTTRLEMVENYVAHGASPRASQYLILGAKVKALLNGRYHASKDDVREVVHDVLRHRLVLNFKSRADRVDADEIIDNILQNVKK
ncbi:MAG: MoxR family ATPase, partial [Spirochaetales bacterium]|nr:MoxR family ATPase [Spirochaetales bacterium]